MKKEQTEHRREPGMKRDRKRQREDIAKHGERDARMGHERKGEKENSRAVTTEG